MKISSAKLTIIATLLLAPVSLAQGELERLKTSYENAVTKAVQPLKVTYEKELRTLLQRYAQAGRLDDAAKVMAELKAIGVSDAEPPTKSSPQNSTSRRVTVEGSSWRSQAGTVFTFEADGKGVRNSGRADQTSFTWRRHSGGLLEVSGLGGKGGRMVTWFFRLESPNEGYYGTNKDDVSMPLERQP